MNLLHSHSSSSSPSIRGALAKLAIANLRALPSATSQAILRDVSPTALSQIDQSLAIEWVPLAIYAPVMDLLYARLGRAAFRAMSRAGHGQVVRMPLFASFTDTTLRLFGARIEAMSFFTRGLSLVVRDCGSTTWRSEHGQERGVLSIRNFPREHFASGAWVEGIAGAIEGAYDLIRTPIQIEVRNFDPSGAADLAVEVLAR